MNGHITGTSKNAAFQKSRLTQMLAYFAAAHAAYSKLGKQAPKFQAYYLKGQQQAQQAKEFYDKAYDDSSSSGAGSSGAGSATAAAPAAKK